MRTLNVSLPEGLAKRVDILLAQQGYASRSEVVRTALRIFFTLEETEESPLELRAFTKRPLTKIENDLIKAGHKSKFIKSVINGLKKSSVYKKQ